MRYTYLILFSSLLSVTALTGQNCFDGIQNGDETGIDCGAPGCEPCVEQYNVIFEEDFENGYGNFVPSGSYTQIQELNNGRDYVRLNRYSYLQSPEVDLSNYSEVTIEFTFRSSGPDNGEYLELQASGNGISFSTVKKWVKGTDFTLNNNTIQYEYTGNSDETMYFRFRMYASSTSEYFYIDDFNVRNYYSAKLPSCFDGVQNGDETGVDCGGSSCEPCMNLGEKCEDVFLNQTDAINHTTFWDVTGWIINYQNSSIYSRGDESILTYKEAISSDKDITFSLDARRGTPGATMYLERATDKSGIYNTLKSWSLNTTRTSYTFSVVPTNEGLDYFYRIRIKGTSHYVHLYYISIVEKRCSNILVAPQWTGSRTLDSTLYRSGAVGIGVPDPGSYKLAVNGDIRAKKVRVEQDGWPDYVFQPQYQLPELPAVEQYIQQHGHLENIPSAETVQAEGIDLGEMDKRLLEKIEQLTLYMIQMDKEVKALREENKALREENKTIKDQLKKLEN